MIYSTEWKYGKYVKEFGFLPFARKFGHKYCKKIKGYCNKNRKRFAKTAFKRVVQKTDEVTGDLIRNKMADQITSVGKTKSKEKEDERQEI